MLLPFTRLLPLSCLLSPGEQQRFHCREADACTNLCSGIIWLENWQIQQTGYDGASYLDCRTN
jgi:hypothetical protein